MIAKDRTRRLARLERQLAAGPTRDHAADLRRAIRDPGAADLPEPVRRLAVRWRLAAVQAHIATMSTATDVLEQLAHIGIHLLPAELDMLGHLAGTAPTLPEHGV